MPSVRRDSRIASAADPQVAAHQRQVARLDRHVGAGAHGQAEVGLGQRGGVVDAVADHRDHPALGLQPPDRPSTFSAGSTSAITSVVDADLGRDRRAPRPRCRRSAAPGCSPRARSRRTASALVGLTASATTSTARARPSQPTATAVRPSASAPRLGVRQRGGQFQRAVGQQLARGRPGPRARPPRPARPAPGDGGEVRRHRERAGAGRAAAAGDGPGDRVLRGVLERAGQPQHLAPRCSPSARCDGDQRHRAGGHGAGLVEHDGVDPAGRLQHLGALDQDAQLRAAPGADHQRGRRGQPQRARAGDDQHGDGRGEGRRRALAERRARRPACRAPAR